MKRSVRSGFAHGVTKLAGGDVNKVVVRRGGETYVPLHLSKEQDIPLAPGDRVWVRTPGGGGYGDPLERRPDAVFEDVRLGRYSVDQAAALYGVVVGKADDGTLSLDEIATGQLRDTMRESRPN